MKSSPVQLIVPVMLALCCAVDAVAFVADRDDTPAQSAIEYRFDAAASVNMLQSRSDAAQLRHKEAPVLAAFADGASAFGSSGSIRWNLQGGFGVGLKTTSNRLALLGIGWSFFIIDNLSLDLEVNGMYFDQQGHDAVGGNVNLLFRWHFLAQETWSIYVDGGAGVLFTNKKVPAHGSTFNFTPQAGFGFSFDIGGDNRLMTGVRWHHVSNANIYRSNPGRDSVMGYVGVSMPF